ncbi:MAG TPA: 23S rRNA (adenine(2030)-N(6))-methyltransferase RlmJ [Pelomicrobium sp.]|nr:23S rRNA (adenine(2030)-N(6))-methyltransferase RlmJ [Pelomicrobium sp.]
MLAYRHLFHAGNFADVFKHALLARLLLAMTAKDKPFCYLDTHAGVGRYDLQHEWAQKLKEWQDGIARLWNRDDVPPLLAPYLAVVRAENRGRNLRFYPGSPRVVARLRRLGDRLVLNELNREDCARLRQLFRDEPGVMIESDDGYHALRTHLPPIERRGLILIDSSFDRAGEYDRVTQGLIDGHRRFATGVYAIWYPLMEAAAVRAFERSVAATGIRKVLRLELSVLPEKWSASLRGCGMLVVNPPFRFDDEAREILAWLQPVLAVEGQGGWTVDWLVPE